MSARSRFVPRAVLLLLAAAIPSAPSALGRSAVSRVGATGAVAQPQQPPKEKQAPDLAAAILPRDAAGF
ncbi:MAG TPA: hypothetical protein VKE74_16330, partial [Gemmataceae bacterium]|nr:hypothetical protein [Gemmataceae bacterium]